MTITRFLLAIILVSGASAQELTWRLRQDVSSKMPNGTLCSAVDAEERVHTG